MVTGVNNALAQYQGIQLFARSLVLTLGFFDGQEPVTTQFNANNAKGVDISGFDMDFVIEKSLKPTEPNTCTIHVYGLSSTTRQKLSGSSKLSVKLEAGYIGGLSQLYFAEARAAWTERHGPEYVTHIESTDSIARPTGVRQTKKIQPGSTTGSLYRTLGPKVPLETAFRTISQALGIGEGNLKAALANVHGAPVNAVNGAALIGNGAQRMTDLCRSAGMEWSIQDNNLQLINIGGFVTDPTSGALKGTGILTSNNQAIRIAGDTGMIDSPAVDSQGAVSVSTLLIPGLAPGVQVVIDSLFVNGGYRVEKCRYHGSTYGNDWTCSFDAVRYT